MKKCVVLCALVALLLSVPAGCRREEGDPGQMAAPTGNYRAVKAVETYDSGILVVDWDERDGALGLCSVDLSDAELTDAAGKAVAASALRPGMVLYVVWDGTVAETWPCRIGADEVRITEQGDDLVGLYRQVLCDLWAEDPALNADAELLGFDFSTLANLTDGEREALKYLAAGDLGMGLDYVSGTWEELCEQGYIDGENLYWEDGVFLSIELTDWEENSAVFTAEEWRSGLGAVWFMDCAAKRGQEGQWSYEPGGFAIS